MTYEELVEASNTYHNAVHDYISENGFDDYLKMEMGSKYLWLQMIAERHGAKLGSD